jgi:aminopeptidase
MADSRILKLAQVITEYSTAVKSGDRSISRRRLAQPLTLAVIEQVIKLGGLPHITAGSGYYHLELVPGAQELLLKYGTDEQIQYVNPFEKMAVNEFDVRIAIKGETNTKALSAPTRSESR